MCIMCGQLAHVLGTNCSKNSGHVVRVKKCQGTSEDVSLQYVPKMTCHVPATCTLGVYLTRFCPC